MIIFQAEALTLEPLKQQLQPLFFLSRGHFHLLCWKSQGWCLVLAAVCDLRVSGTCTALQCSSRACSRVRERALLTLIKWLHITAAFEC